MLSPSDQVAGIFRLLKCMQSSLVTIAASPQIETSGFLLVCDDAVGQENTRYLSFAVYDEDTGLTTRQLFNLDGTPATPVGNVVACDDGTDELQDILTELLAQGISLDSILTALQAINVEILAQGLSLDALVAEQLAQGLSLDAILDELQNQTAQTPGLLQGHTVVLDTVSNTEQLVTAAGVGADSVTIHNTSAVWVRATFADFGAEVINGNKVIIMAPASTKSMTFKRNSIESVSFVEVEPPTVTSQASVNQVVPAAATVAGIILVDFFEE